MLDGCQSQAILYRKRVAKEFPPALARVGRLLQSAESPRFLTEQVDLALQDVQISRGEVELERWGVAFWQCHRTGQVVADIAQEIG